jgi:hypothetical protein
LKIPLALLGRNAGDRLAFIVWLRKDDVEIEHHPRHGPIEVAVPTWREAL